MTDLLTTKQVQELLRVDRTTIYRMVESGQLPAVRVGKQWRFAREQVEDWLRGGRSETLWSGRPASENGRPQPAAFNLQLASSGTSLPAAKSESDLRDLLSLTCTQLIQDTFADILGVMIVITDMQGHPVTRISNASGFFSALTPNNASAVSQCVVTWQQFAAEPALEPKWVTNEMGLLCARALIRVGSELKGMVMLGGIAPEGWPPPEQQVAALARQFGAEPLGVLAHVQAVHRLDPLGQEKALRSVQRIADIFAHLIEDRNTAQSQSTDWAEHLRGQI